jgi:hypothetical protein
LGLIKIINIIEGESNREDKDDKSNTEYVAQENIGFNELVRRLGTSPAQVAKIQKGEANLTMSSLAHIFALLKKRPHTVVANS